MSVKKGKIVGNDMQKTVSVEIISRKPDPKYKKVIQTSSVFLVHVPEEFEGKLDLGMVIEIAQCRPMSKRKSFKVISIIDNL
jgi:small subunit ribosomal protein S17